MASEDVIELGSSDEESEPAPKKANMAKRRPNAMVQIPSGLTIKPTKPTNHTINPIKKLIGKGLIVTKVHGANKNSSNVRNGKPIRLPQPQQIKSSMPALIPVQRPAIHVRPASLLNPLNMMNKINSARPSKAQPLNLPIKVQNVKSINNLPSSITVTKKAGPNVTGIRVPGIKPAGFAGPIIVGKKRSATTNTSNVKKKRKLAINQQMQTVNLDDEEVPTTSTASPQWYLRPEDTILPDVSEKEKQTNEEPSMEKQNNAEPIKFVEITIDDSPIKPIHNKRTHEVGAELAITIDDSPVKAAATKEVTSAGSDNEKTEQSPKERQSKKKLEYPKDVVCQKNFQNSTVIEIELEPIDNKTDDENVDNSNTDKTNKKSDEEVIINEEPIKPSEKVVKKDLVIEVFESPAKTVPTPPCTPKKVAPERQKVKPITITSEASQPSEFHPSYQEFIDLCLQLENSTDMKTIVEKKIKNYYRQVPKEYRESEEFVELVQSKLLSMRAGPEKLYLYIKDIVDELNLQRKLAKAKPTIKETSTLEAEKFQYGEESEFDSKRQRQIRKLEKTLKKLHRAIQKLEEQEVDFDDEEDSVYLLTESDDSSSSMKDLDKELKRERSVLLKRYKERMVRVHAKFCQLTNTKMPSEPRIQIQQRPGQPAGPAKRLEKWVNKKVPIGKPLPFPDFHDVLRCVREANDEDNLGWNEAEIMEEARDLFTRCGKKLQRRRQENEWRLAASRISLETDPAEISDELKKKLDSNKQVAAKKETEVFNKYADKQSQLKLEAVEIGDKEADESPVESEEEEPQEESSNLENKEKRKERLRRLISEKSKKTENKETKDISPSEEKPASADDSKKDSEKGEHEKIEIDLVPEDVNKDSVEVVSVSKSTNDENLISKERIHSISEDSKVDSDVDELHLLQKLHSDEFNTSTVETTDSGSPIDISDTLTSSDNKKPSNSDVISIENSSYSETESKDDNPIMDVKEGDTEKGVVEKTENVDIVCTSSIIQKNKTNNQEYNESVESILLATTDEEAEDDRDNDDSPRSNEECVNLKDDAISIGETIIEKGDENKSETVTSHEVTSLQQSESHKLSDENSIKGVALEVNCKNSDESEETAKSVETITEEENDLTAEAEPNIKNKAKTDSVEVIEEIHSVESIESDKLQEVAKEQIDISKAGKQESVAKDDHCIDSADITDSKPKGEAGATENKQQSIRIQKLTLESIESDNSQENDEGNDIVMTDIQHSNAMDNPSVETVESDNSQEVKLKYDDIMEDEQQPNFMNSLSVETLESDNSQEAVKEMEDVVMADEPQSEIIESLPFEVLESDNSQEIVKEMEDVVMADESQSEIIQNLPLEVLESDNSQEAAKEAEEPTKTNEQKSAKMDISSVKTLESDNFQELTKQNEKAVAEKQELHLIDNPIIETLESDNSQEPAKETDNENGDQQSQAAKNIIIEKESLDIHELTDSSSPDQVSDRIKDASRDEVNKINENGKCGDTDTENILENTIENLRSEIAVTENLATTTAVNE